MKTSMMRERNHLGLPTLVLNFLSVGEDDGSERTLVFPTEHRPPQHLAGHCA